MSLHERLTRIRNSRGFGVHSPFAYNLARLVVRPSKGYAYYGYAAIDRTCCRDRSNTTRDAARMLLRLLTFLTSSGMLSNHTSLHPLNNWKVFTAADCHPAFPISIKNADSRFIITHNKKDADDASIIAADADIFSLEEWLSLVKSPGRVLLIAHSTESLIQNLFSEMPEGLLIKGEQNIIIIHRPDMQKVSYMMKI